METTPSKPPTKRTTSLPPQRGKVKAQIFESLAGNLSSAVKFLAKLKGGSSTAPAVDNSTSASASVATSPPTSSAYTSDGYPDQA